MSPSSSRGGAPRAGTNLEPAALVGVDVGGTNIRAGVVQLPSGRLEWERSCPTGPERGGAAVLADVVALAEALTADAAKSGTSIAGIGIGLCELIDPTGRILSRNCVSWHAEEVRRRLAHLGPVVLEADVRAAARAEARFGAGRPYGIFLYLTVGTGISCCLVLEGSPYLGASGATGTVASSPLAVPCPQCGAVNRQSLEQMAAGPALVERFNQRRLGAAGSGFEVLAAAEAGDPLAAEVVRSAGEALGAGVGWLVNVLDPEAIVIGGGLGLSTGCYWESLVAASRAHIWSEVHRELPILQAATGPSAGMIGAAIAAWEQGGASRSCR